MRNKSITFASSNNKIMTTKKTNKKGRSLSEIAREIKKSWGEKMYFGAKPYVSAMLSLGSIKDNYGCDSAEMIVRYFLSNACSWRGEDARRIKKELNEMLKDA
jgi:hypothetical protein